MRDNTQIGKKSRTDHFQERNTEKKNENLAKNSNFGTYAKKNGVKNKRKVILVSSGLRPNINALKLINGSTGPSSMYGQQPSDDGSKMGQQVLTNNNRPFNFQ